MVQFCQYNLQIFANFLNAYIHIFFCFLFIFNFKSISSKLCTFCDDCKVSPADVSVQ